MKTKMLGLLIGCVMLVVTANAWSADADRLSGVGFGVADLEVSRAFSDDVLGLEVLRIYELGYLNEIFMGYKDSTQAVVVLMNWPNEERTYDGNNVKLVFDVDDPAAVISRIRARGGKIDREAGPIDALPGAIVGLGRDPDNYVVEVLKR